MSHRHAHGEPDAWERARPARWGARGNGVDRKTATAPLAYPISVKVRDHGRVVSKALVVAYAVHETGVREVIGLDVGEVESGAFWTEFLRGLKKRGLAGVRLAVSDDHEGLKAAIARVLACPWQRCTVHFIRDMVCTAAAISAAWSPPPCARCSTPRTKPRRAERVGHVLERPGADRAEGVPSCWRTPRRT